MLIRRGSLAFLTAVSLTATAVRAQQPPLADSTRRDSVPAVLIGKVTDSLGIGLPGAELTLFQLPHLVYIEDLIESPFAR